MTRRLAMLAALGALLAPGPAAQAGPPPRPYVAKDGCPFECCQYGAWTATRALTVRAAPRRDARKMFELPAGTLFEALGGEVHATRPGMIRIRRAMPYDTGEEVVQFATGDTIWLLFDYGEGAVAAWHGDRLITVSFELWFRELAAPGERPPAELLRDYAYDWWVEVKDARGRTGWLLMPDQGLPVNGADGCG